MHYGYSVSLEIQIFEENDLYISQKNFSLFYSQYNTIMQHGFQNSNKINCVRTLYLTTILAKTIVEKLKKKKT